MANPDALKAVIALNSSGSDISVTGGAGGTSMVDESGFTPGGSSLTPVGGYVGPDAVASGRTGAFAMTPMRAMHAYNVDASGNYIAPSGFATVNIQGAVAVGSMPPLPSGNFQIGIVVIGSMPGIVGSVILGSPVPSGDYPIGRIVVSQLPPLPSGNFQIGTVVVGSRPPIPSGNYPIGTVVVGSMPAIAGTVTIGAEIPAGTQIIGRIVAHPESGALYIAGVAATPKFAAIALTNSGDNTVVSAVAGKKIRVLREKFIADRMMTARYYSHGSASGGAAISGPLICATYGGLVDPLCQLGIRETVASQHLVLNLSASAVVGGDITYIEV